MLGTVFAMIAMFYAWKYESREFAFFFLITIFIDGVDGIIASKLNVKSQFGIINDTLSDLVASGVAPVVCLSLLELIHPVVGLVYVLCIQFRLIRFTVDDSSGEKFFHGLPAPDCVYIGLLLGMVMNNFNLAMLAVSAMAVYPKRFWPMQFKPIKLAVAIVSIFGFVRLGAI